MSFIKRILNFPLNVKSYEKFELLLLEKIFVENNWNYLPC